MPAAHTPEQYYATEGVHDAIRSSFPSGTYVPLISRTEVTSTRCVDRASSRTGIGGRLPAFCPRGACRLSIEFAGSPPRHGRNRAPGPIRHSTPPFPPTYGGWRTPATNRATSISGCVLHSGEPRRLTSDGRRRRPDFSRDAKETHSGLNAAAAEFM
jgi:hypothetical protein